MGTKIVKLSGQNLGRLLTGVVILLAVLALVERVYTLRETSRATATNIALLKAVMPVIRHQDNAAFAGRVPPVTDDVTGFQARALAQLAFSDDEIAVAEKWLAKGLTDLPSADLTQFEMCRLYWNAGRFDLSMEACRGTVASAQYWLARGFEADDAGDRDKALAYYYMAAYTDTDLIEAWQHLGHALYAKGYYDQTVLAMERVLAVDPSPAADVYDTLGSAYLKLGNTSMARDVLNRGLFRYADQRVYYIGMANSYRLDGDLETADSWYVRLLQRWPFDAQTWAARGELAMAMGRSADAISYFKEATNYQPDGSGYWLNLALVAAAVGDVDQATAAYQAALALRPADINVWLQAGRYLAETGQTDDARVIFERVLALQPDNDEALAQLAALVDIPRRP